jgi:predicted dehydrogenase
VAVTGLGGYARHHHLKLQRLEAEGLCRVVATCDPSLGQMLPPSADLRLAARGVKTFSSFEAMLEGSATGLDAITLPTPIHTHAPMHRACVERGVPVYLEKPPTLWWEELETMIATDARAVRATEVGFNFITEPARAALKARLLAGEFGALRAAAFLGLWPRPAAYFKRNDWAGKIFRAGAPVPLLDSCVGNAMGHYVQNLLYWAGPGPAGIKEDINRDDMIAAITQTIRDSSAKGGGFGRDLHAEINPKTGALQVWASFKVVDSIADPATEILLEKARHYTSSAKPGDLITKEIDPALLGRIAAQTARRVIMQRRATPAGFATVLDVRSSLHRAHDIAGPDTVFAEGRTPDGVALRFAATHACPPESEGHAEYLFCEHAQLRYVTDRDCEIRWTDGRRETIDLRTQGDWQERNFRRYFDYLAGKHAAPVVSLRDCRPFVAWNDLIFAAARGISTFAREQMDYFSGGTIPAPRGLTAALRDFAETGRWPHESGDYIWAREPGRAHLADLPLALGKIRALAEIQEAAT